MHTRLLTRLWPRRTVCAQGISDEDALRELLALNGGDL